MATHAQVCDRWIQSVRWAGVRSVKSSSVWFAGNTIYSYGRHFPLAEYYPAGVHGRRRPLMLLNGDANSVTTARHQREIRSAVAGVKSRTWPELESIIIPFSALDAAGIDRATIRPLEVRDDRTDVWRESVPGDFHAIQWGPMAPATAGAGNGDSATSQTGSIPGGNGAHAVRYLRHWDYRENRYVETDPESAAIHFYTAGGSGIDVDSEGKGSVEHRRHWLGDSLFTAAVRHEITRRRPLTVADVVRAARWGNANELELMPEVLTETVMVRRRRKFVSSFDYNEPRSLYFLATMPAGRAQTVADAILELAPRAVHAAMARDIDVERQGDIFAIATPLSDSEVYGRAISRARRTMWTAGARPRKGEVGAPDYARMVRHAKRDRAEWRRRYVALRAEQWRMWDSLRGMARDKRNKAMRLNERRHYRRHTFSHAETALNTATGQTMDKYAVSREKGRRDMRAALSVYGTAHTATEVVKTRGGAVYLRGIMYHEPSLEEGRGGDADHIRRKLGNGATWYLALRNTVPRAGR